MNHQSHGNPIKKKPACLTIPSISDFKVGPEVVLLTDDKACQGKATSDGLLALRAAEFVAKMRKKCLGWRYL